MTVSRCPLESDGGGTFFFLRDIFWGEVCILDNKGEKRLKK